MSAKTARGKTLPWRAGELRAPLIIAETDFYGEIDSAAPVPSTKRPAPWGWLKSVVPPSTDDRGWICVRLVDGRTRLFRPSEIVDVEMEPFEF